MAHDVFVSYSQHDKATADAVVARLEQDGSRCWIAPRDVVPGSSWGSAIIDAITGARIMVLVLSEHSNRSRQVVREVEQAVARDVIILPFRIDPADPTGAMAYFLGTQHWLDALTPPMEQHIARLSRTVRMLLDQGSVPAEELDLPPPVVRHAPRPANRWILVVGSAAVGTAALLAITLVLTPGRPTGPGTGSAGPSPSNAPVVGLAEVGRYQPVDLDLTDLEVPGPIVGFDVEGTRLAYANGSDGVTLMSIADPARPRPTVTLGGGNARDVAFAGEDVVAATSDGSLGAVLLTADGDVLGRVAIDDDGPTDIAGIEVEEGTAYLASHNYLGILETGGPDGLRLATGWIPPAATGNRAGTFVSGRTAYVTAGWDGLYILDTTDPGSPAALGHWASPGWVIDAAVVDGIAVLTLGDSGVALLDVTLPAAPRLLGSTLVPGFAGPIAVSGGHAFVGTYGSGTGTGGVAIVDVRDPSAPVLVATVGRFPAICEVAITDGHLVVGDESEGLVVYRIDGLDAGEVASMPPAASSSQAAR